VAVFVHMSLGGFVGLFMGVHLVALGRVSVMRRLLVIFRA
jgi:hypothetical protein